MAKYWQTKTLAQMSTEEWELLCDGCAKCCLVKLEDYESGEIFHTNVTCELLDTVSCRCSNYEGRHQVVDDCIQLGTIPFSILARHGFIAKTILLSFEQESILTSAEINEIQSGVHTVASELVDDMYS